MCYALAAFLKKFPFSSSPLSCVLISLLGKTEQQKGPQFYPFPPQFENLRSQSRVAFLWPSLRDSTVCSHSCVTQR